MAATQALIDQFLIHCKGNNGKVNRHPWVLAKSPLSVIASRSLAKQSPFWAEIASSRKNTGSRNDTEGDGFDSNNALIAILLTMRAPDLPSACLETPLFGWYAPSHP
jgi:hypothetical protein